MQVAYEEAAQHNWSREAFDAYIYSGIRAQDEKGRIESEKNRARNRERNRLIISFYSNGVPLDMIAKSVGISEQEVSKIIENQGDK
jgi:DNA invertase Pin-like site-specific DNA recombinase